jgi:hypothetical protein
LRRGLERDRACTLASRRATDSVRNHRHEREALIAEREAIELGKIGIDNVHAPVNRGEKKVILVLRTHLSAIGDSVDVVLLIARLSVGHG